MWSTNVNIAFLGALFAGSAFGETCPPLGPVFPEPKVPCKSEAVAEAIADLRQSLDNFTSEFKASGLSVGVQSIYEDAPLFEYHFTPAMRDNQSVSTVDGNTSYRVASITKVFSVLTAMKSDAIDMDAPITRYLPELSDLSVPDGYEKDAIDPIAWDQITVKSLGNYLSGLGRDSKTRKAALMFDQVSC